MTTLEIYDDPIESAAQPAAAAGSSWTISRLLQAWRQRRAERQTLAMLRHFDTRTLIDIGIDPAEIHASRVGTWREEFGDAWKGLK